MPRHFALEHKGKELRFFKKNQCKLISMNFYPICLAVTTRHGEIWIIISKHLNVCSGWPQCNRLLNLQCVLIFEAVNVYIIKRIFSLFHRISSPSIFQFKYQMYFLLWYAVKEPYIHKYVMKLYP